MKTFNLTIARVDGPLYEGPARQLMVPSVDGDLTVLPDHTPLITPLRAGTLTVMREDGTVESFESTGGTLQIDGASASVLL